MLLLLGGCMVHAGGAAADLWPCGDRKKAQDSLGIKDSPIVRVGEPGAPMFHCCHAVATRW